MIITAGMYGMSPCYRAVDRLVIVHGNFINLVAMEPDLHHQSTQYPELKWLSFLWCFQVFQFIIQRGFYALIPRYMGRPALAGWTLGIDP